MIAQSQCHVIQEKSDVVTTLGKNLSKSGE